MLTSSSCMTLSRSDLTMATLVASPSKFLSASTAILDVILFKLYGAFILFKVKTISSCAIATPQRIPARPHDLENVCNTTRFGYWETSDA